MWPAAQTAPYPPSSALRYELDAITYALRVYDPDRPNRDDYIASALVRIYGDRAWVSSISSPRLFEVLSDLPVILDALGVQVMEGYMSESMARALRIAARGKARYRVERRGQCAGRKMVWVELSMSQANTECRDTPHG